MKNKRLYLIIMAVLWLPVHLVQAQGIHNEWRFAGWMGGGAYPAIVPDPNVEGRLYLTSDVAGIWRSDNRGENWYFINNGLANLNVPILAVAPSDSNVLYAGSVNGIMRSDNAGRSWRFLETTAGKITFSKEQNNSAIWVDEIDPKKIYVGTKAGQIFFTRNGGFEWQSMGRDFYPFGQNIPITSLQLSSDGSKLFVASGVGLKRFDVNEGSWENLFKTPVKVQDMKMSKGTQTLYVASDNKIAVSTDYGMTWTHTNTIPNGEITHIDITRTNEGAIKISAAWKKGWEGGVFLSEDNGTTWTNVERNLHHDVVGNPSRVWMKGFERPNDLVWDPKDPDILYFTDTWGVWRSTDNGKTWYEKINGAPNSSGSDIKISKDGIIFVATMDQGILKSSDGGLFYEAFVPNAKLFNGIAGHFWRILLDDESQNVLATLSPWSKDHNQVMICQYQEKSCRIITTGLPPQYPKENTMWTKGYPRSLVVDPKNRERIYLGIDGNDGGGLYKSEDAGSTWSKSIGQPGSLRIYNGLVVDPVKTKILYWGAFGKDGGVYQSEDYGVTWKRVFSQNTMIFDMAVNSRGDVYAATAGSELYVSNNRGKHWRLLQKFKSGSACEAVTIDPNDEDRIFVGTVSWEENSDGHIYYTSDGGKTWSEISQGLPRSQGPAAMAVHPKENALYIILYSGSVYKRSIAGLEKSR